MTRVHDMGGRYGDGEIPEKDDSVVFHTKWEARTLATTLAIGGLGLWNIDASRHSRERLMPQEYASFTYYEKWLAAATNMLVENGALTLADLDRASDIATGKIKAMPNTDLNAKALKAGSVTSVLRNGSPYIRESGPAALFAIGDQVRTASHSPNHTIAGGHTRLPSYAMGRVGRIVMRHGNHVLPDSNAHGLGEAPEPLYAVEFKAGTLWPDDAESPDDTMILDLWQNYLEAA